MSVGKRARAERIRRWVRRGVSTAIVSLALLTPVGAQFAWTGPWAPVALPNPPDTGPPADCTMSMAAVGDSILVDSNADVDEKLTVDSYCERNWEATRPFTIGPLEWEVKLTSELDGVFILGGSGGSVAALVVTQVDGVLLASTSAFDGETVAGTRPVSMVGTKIVCLQPGTYMARVQATNSSQCKASLFTNADYVSDFTGMQFMKGTVEDDGACPSFPVPALDPIGMAVLAACVASFGWFFLRK